MSFKLNVTTATRTSGGTKKEVDWEALNEHIVNAAGTAKKARSIPGYISGIYDLGEQNREDAEVDASDADFRKRFPEYNGSEESKKEVIAKRAGSYFKQEGGKTFYCYPQKPVQQIAIAVDFPQIIVDKGQFFGDSHPAPLRMLLNGEFHLRDVGSIVGKPFSIVEKKYDDGTWAFAKNSGLHKLADACGILDDNGYFKKEHIGELLGKVAQFKMQVWMKPSKKDPSKKFLTEDISLAGMVPEGVPVPEHDESLLHGINLYGDNDEAAVKQLRVAVRNTIKRANNYENSDIRPLIEKLEEGKQQNSKPAAPKPAQQVEQPEAEPEDDFSEDCPF